MTHTYTCTRLLTSWQAQELHSRRNSTRQRSSSEKQHPQWQLAAWQQQEERAAAAGRMPEAAARLQSRFHRAWRQRVGVWFC